MDIDTTADFKARLQNMIVYQDILIKNNFLAQSSCDQEFSTLLIFHNDLRRKYADLRAQTDQLDQYIEHYRAESERKDKKIQSQSSQILRLTQHNKRNNERLTELQRWFDRIKDSITEPSTYNKLYEILRNSHMSEGETTADLSDRYCTGDELDVDYSHMPKVVSQSAGIGEIKRLTDTNDIDLKLHKSPVNISAASDRNVNKNKPEPNQLRTSPIHVSSRKSLSIHQRPKQKIRKPSKEFLNTKSEELELSIDDQFWSKHIDDHHEQKSLSPINSALPKLISPTIEQKTLTPSTPASNLNSNSSPSNITKLHSRGHNFISRNILIPETCCVCLKRIHFGKLAYRCQGCNALCHTGCKENCTTLCLPNVKTPNRGAVCKFSPREPNQLQIPALLVHCINEIEQRGLQELGLYRLNVIESQAKELKDRILKSRTGLFDLSHYNDIHLICGVVKDFLRSLSESLLTDAQWKSFASAVDEEFDSIKHQKFDSLIHQLPKPNRDTLAFIILHLQRVSTSTICRMPILNLSRTMGPAVIGYSSKHVSGIDLVGETYKQTKLLEFFLQMPSNYWSKFLEINNSNMSTTPITKDQIGTPVLIRQFHFQKTPTINYPAPSTTFFSPI
ncbi:unnamed protein product [Rotaria magnacalcarata]|uniref:Rac GTPase-activating protein 1 n=5 Tax=Rotaria magnacalcarata TaxID=392030 RepID=A0A816B222_9BILA|nr:unnamed protein product [Rotaria magnacalcarata]CAF3915237.1 unnamed protein product [Rotaria magnacalcarata]